MDFLILISLLYLVMVKPWIHKFGSSPSQIINYGCWGTSSFFPAPTTILAAQVSKEERARNPFFVYRLHMLILQMLWVKGKKGKGVS
jgi:hypothetical protein